MSKINQKTVLIVALIVVVIILGVVLAKFKSGKENTPPITQSDCKNKEFQIPLTLQSGEKGTLYIMDKRCNPPFTKKTELSFKVLDDGAVQNNLNLSKLYIWLRNVDFTIGEQIKSILKNQFHKADVCLVKKYDFPYYDNLFSYDVDLDLNSKSMDLPEDYCLMYSSENIYSAEDYMESNNLLIALRQNGSDGIEPFNLSSIKFVKD